MNVISAFSGLYYPPLATSHKLLANSVAYQTKHSYANPITSFELPKLKVWTKTLGFAICCDIDILNDQHIAEYHTEKLAALAS